MPKLEEFKYEQRLVIYLDVLGWAAFTSDADADLKKIFTAWCCLNRFRTVAESAARPQLGPLPWHPRIQATFFSDTLVISASVGGEAAFAMANDLVQICLGLLSSGFLWRGAIVCGPLFHREGIVFGPALIQAWRLAEVRGAPPRVLIEEDVMRLDIIDAFTRQPPFVQFARLDDDGAPFIDFLGAYLHGRSQQESLGALEPVRARVLENLEDARVEEKERNKWAWIGRYFNRVLAEHMVPGVDPIDSKVLSAWDPIAQS